MLKQTAKLPTILSKRDGVTRRRRPALRLFAFYGSQGLCWNRQYHKEIQVLAQKAFLDAPISVTYLQLDGKQTRFSVKGSC